MCSENSMSQFAAVSTAITDCHGKVNVTTGPCAILHTDAVGVRGYTEGRTVLPQIRYPQILKRKPILSIESAKPPETDETNAKPDRPDGWYWVRKMGWGEQYGEWLPAEWKQEFRSWASTRFSGIPDSEMIVGTPLRKADDKLAPQTLPPVMERTDMLDIEQRGHEALHQAFCRLRYFSKFSLNEEGRKHLFLVADTAHNIPMALSGDRYHAPYLERDVLALEALLSEPYGVATSRYAITPTRSESFNRFGKWTAGGAILSFGIGVVAGLAGLVSDIAPLWKVAYGFYGFALLLGLLYGGSNALQKRGLW